MKEKTENDRKRQKESHKMILQRIQTRQNMKEKDGKIFQREHCSFGHEKRCLALRSLFGV